MNLSSLQLIPLPSESWCLRWSWGDIRSPAISQRSQRCTATHWRHRIPPVWTEIARKDAENLRFHRSFQGFLCTCHPKLDKSLALEVLNWDSNRFPGAQGVWVTSTSGTLHTSKPDLSNMKLPGCSWRPFFFIVKNHPEISKMIYTSCWIVNSLFNLSELSLFPELVLRWFQPERRSQQAGTFSPGVWGLSLEDNHTFVFVPQVEQFPCRNFALRCLDCRDRKCGDEATQSDPSQNSIGASVAFMGWSWAKHQRFHAWYMREEPVNLLLKAS